MSEKLFLHLLNFSFLVPLIFLVANFKKIRVSPILIVVTSYLILFFLLNFFFKEIRHFTGKKLYYFIYTLFEYLTFTYLLSYNISNKKFRWLVITLSAAFILFMIVFYIKAPIGRIDSIPVGIETIIILIYIFYFFYDHFRQLSSKYIYEYTSFWFVMGILVYLGGTFFFNILANSLDQEHYDKYFYLSYLGDIIKNLLFTVAIIQHARTSHSNEKLKNTNLPYLDIT